MKGFYKGIIPTTAKAVVATAVTFAAYEVLS
jgi:Mitochondrial carrier protein